jgi:hypothetical protein
MASSWLRGVVMGTLVALPVAALASPYCLENQAIPPQCIYEDPGQCQSDAFRQGGVCSANPKEAHLTANVGQYCMVTGSGISLCVYSDRDTCTKDAMRQNGACIFAPQIAPSGAPDPYAAIGGR